MKTDILEFSFGIFDVNGTLIDNRVLYRKAIALVVKLGWGVEGRTDLYLPTGGIPLPPVAYQLQQSRGLTWLALKADRSLMKICGLLDRKELRLFEGTQDVLEELYRKEIKLFASTGTDTPTIKKHLEKLNVLRFFTMILGSDKTPESKHFHYFAKHLNLPFKEFTRKTFLVSDGPADLNHASKSGIYSIGITNTLNAELLRRAGARETISDLRELLQ